MSKIAHRVVLVLIVFILGCSFDTSGPSGDDRDGGGPNPDGSWVDAELGIDARVIDAPPPPDQDNCTTECLSATSLHDCSAGESVECALGCFETGTPHCGQLVPSNGATVTQLSGVGSGLHLAMDDLADIDSDDGTIILEGATLRAGGIGVGPSGIGFFTLDTHISVVAVDDFTMAEGSNLRVHGSRSLIVLAKGAVVIEGIIDVAGGCDVLGDVKCRGPGGGPGAVFGGANAGGCGPGGNGWGGSGIPEAGGGGGALGKNGAKGGDGNEITLGGAAGWAATCPGASAVPLRGGSGGGTGHDTGTGDGGGGGGGLQITSFDSISILGADAAIWAGGAGGGGTSAADGGGGGGSGGTILLEAPAITIDQAAVAANGGGGGHGAGGADGEYGTLTTTAATGGTSSEVAVGAGGNGGGRYVDALPGNGPVDGAGGGGGGVGIIRFNVPAADLTTIGAVISPQESHGELVVE